MSAMNITQTQFQEMLTQGKTLLVDYWAPWCGYCRRIGPAYDKVADQYAPHLTAVKVNIDEEGALAEAEKIEVIPTLVLYREGKAIGSIVAPASKAKIDAFLQTHLGL